MVEAIILVEAVAALYVVLALPFDSTALVFVAARIFVEPPATGFVNGEELVAPAVSNCFWATVSVFADAPRFATMSTLVMAAVKFVFAVPFVSNETAIPFVRPVKIFVAPWTLTVRVFVPFPPPDELDL